MRIVWLLFVYWVTVINGQKITFEENQRRLKTCGILTNPTSGLPNVRARDAPWLIDVQLYGNTITPGVIIAPNRVIITGRSSLHPDEPRYLLEDLVDSCRKGVRTIGGTIGNGTETVCVDAECKQQKNNTLDIDAMHIVGPCDDVFSQYFVIRVRGTFTNTPICLPGGKPLVPKDPVMVHAPSRFHSNVSIGLEAPVKQLDGNNVLTEDLQRVPIGDFGSPLVRKSGRYELVGISLDGGKDASLYQMIEPTERYLCIDFYICAFSGGTPTRLREPGTFSKLSFEENKERVDECGLSLNDTTWLVDVISSTGENSTGAIISSRHILTDERIFKGIDVGGSSDSGFRVTEWPTSRVNISLKAIHNVCDELGCKLVELSPIKVATVAVEQWVKKLVIMEFDGVLRATPICLQHSKGYSKDEDYVYTIYDSERTKIHINNTNGMLAILDEDSPVVTAGLRASVTLVDQYTRLLLVGYDGQRERNMVAFTDVQPVQRGICVLTGVCRRGIEWDEDLENPSRDRPLKTADAGNQKFTDPEIDEDETEEEAAERENESYKLVDRRKGSVERRKELLVLMVFVLIWSL